jgi:hypothetical protein
VYFKKGDLDSYIGLPHIIFLIITYVDNIDANLQSYFKLFFEVVVVGKLVANLEG